MDIRTENLTILFVDIAGFTATTSRQSRAENAHLLQTFEKTLLPLIKRFKGNVVKSIGDALLLTFRSPTDAMLCSMALQDAMHAHNLRAPEDEKIHIRVAANLGEVRVTKKDIFGEPVNVASRIEGVAPADEIYLSEAVYMAMNKAEVPAQEVGFKQLAGITQPVRVYSIPRFATHRLVPQNVLSPDQGSELLFPYGGMHQRVPERTGSFQLPSSSLRRYGVIGLAVIGASALALLGGYLWLKSGSETATAAPTQTPTTAISSRDETGAPVIEIPANHATAITQSQTAQPAVEKPVEKSIEKPSEPIKVASPEPVTTKPVAPTKSEPTQTVAVITKPRHVEPVAEKRALTPAEVVVYKPTSPAKTTTAPAKPAEQWNVTKAKAAYRAGQLTKVEYKQIVEKLETVYDARIRELKLAYRASKISETEYENQVREAKQAYSGR